LKRASNHLKQRRWLIMIFARKKSSPFLAKSKRCIAHSGGISAPHAPQSRDQDEKISAIRLWTINL
jgi:hypothetical protein